MKVLFLLLTFCFLHQSFALEDCHENSHYRVLSQYMHYDYAYVDGKHELISKEKRTTVLFEDWSEPAAELFEVFFETRNGADRPDRVIISYKFDGQVLYTKNLTLEDSELADTQGEVQKISSFTFSDGVMKKKLRPATQTFSFFRGDRPLCEKKVKHIFAKEDN